MLIPFQTFRQAKLDYIGWFVFKREPISTTDSAASENDVCIKSAQK